MKRFILSAFSVVLAAGAVAPHAAAFPQPDPNFKLQTLRLREFDTRNKSEAEDAYYPYEQTPAQASEWTRPENNVVEPVKPAAAEAVTDALAEETDEISSQPISINERRLQALDRD